jgi:hypothetical protein
MTVELHYRENQKDRMKDLPEDSTVEQWKNLFSSSEKNEQMEKDRNALILRYMVYARNRIEEDLLSGSQLSLIDLVDLRRITIESLQRVIRYQSSLEETDESGLCPLKEIIGQFSLEVLDVPIQLVNKHWNPGFAEYLRRRHEQMHMM